MSKRKTRKFIDRKAATTFRLVSRSQRDPLTADENAPQRVLVPEISKKDKKQIEEQHKYGIYFDDDYNYLQHLRESGTMEWEQVSAPQKQESAESKLKLPSSVFASEVEESVGLLNKAAPQSLRLDLDPDVVAAMDEDFDYDDPENQLEDDFIQLANQECSDKEYEEGEVEYEEEEDVDSNFGSEERDELPPMEECYSNFDEEETKTTFSTYSKISSLAKRNLIKLDEVFEEWYTKEYAENKIGAEESDEDEDEETINQRCIDFETRLLQADEEFQKKNAPGKLGKPDQSTKSYLEQYSNSESEEEEMVKVEVKAKPKWDCESILSTYSNLYNHPKVISCSETKKMKKKKPKDVSDEKTTESNQVKEDQGSEDELSNNDEDDTNSIATDLSLLSFRPKYETVEEKRLRKKLVKEHKKQRRQEKKENSKQFKEALITMNKSDINRQRMLGTKIV